MKKTLIISLIILASMAGSTFAATQYNSIGSVALSTSTVTGGFGLWNQTVAQLKLLTPSTTGQVVYCSDCISAGALGTVCVSTGSTAAYQWVLSTGTACK